MARNKLLTVPYRRKREGKTNYKKRLHLLISRQHRLVIRASLNNIVVQLVEYHPEGDKVLVSASSKELTKLGWNHNKGNLPASYLTGQLFGKKAKGKKYTEAILDLGLQTRVKGSRIYTALKGVVDSGFTVPHDESIFPDEDRLRGTHINDNVVKDFDKMMATIAK